MILTFLRLLFLYRHSLELSLKAIGFQYVNNVADRKAFVKNTRHNLGVILSSILEKSGSVRNRDEMEWLKKYFEDLSRVDRESDSFRYPFHIVCEADSWSIYKRYDIKPIFKDQTHIDLVKFANKFEAAYEIVRKWYLKESDAAIEWASLNPLFIETGGYYYEQSVVGYQYHRDDFYPYTKAYLETANYLKWYIKNQTDLGNHICKDQLFLPMCYLYRNCVELSLKTILFEDTAENFQTKCVLMLDKKHSIEGMWKSIKPYVLDCLKDNEGNIRCEDLESIAVIEDYCMQIQKIDSDASKFRYPMTNNMQVYFSQNKRFDLINVGDFLEALNNILRGIDDQIGYINEIKAEMEAEYLSYVKYDYSDYE